ncbi:MAG: UpxY family transcription antiterminator [Bacteroidales bacterium]|nr:UpxY family transcription antiterminator [Bacteroidales bacterium]
MPKGKKWYIFYCKSRAEKKANEELIARGYNPYLPTIQQDRVWSDRIKTVNLPMLPGYIFVNCFDYDIVNIVQLSQIVSVVRFGKDFAKIRQSEIDILKKVELHGLKVIVEHSIINLGDKVEIYAGVLRNQQGYCIEEAGNNYFVIAIEGINQSIKIKIDKGMVRKV